MTMEMLGQAICLLVGAAAGIGGTVSVLKRVATPAVIAYVAAGGFIGLAMYGPEFLRPYGSFLDDLLSSQRSDEYQQFLTDVGAGKVPPNTRDVGIAYMLQNPVGGMEGMLERAAQGATDTAGRAILDVTRTQYATQIEMSKKFVRSQEFQGLSSQGKAWAARPLLELDESRLRELDIDPGAVRNLRRVLQPRDSPR